MPQNEYKFADSDGKFKKIDFSKAKLLFSVRWEHREREHPHDYASKYVWVQYSESCLKTVKGNYVCVNADYAREGFITTVLKDRKHMLQIFERMGRCVTEGNEIAERNANTYNRNYELSVKDKKLKIDYQEI